MRREPTAEQDTEVLSTAESNIGQLTVFICFHQSINLPIFTESSHRAKAGRRGVSASLRMIVARQSYYYIIIIIIIVI
jgi:hypothetical protein